jgi:hypothetical protein
MNTIPCVYVATMKGCDYGEKCRNAHYANQLTNIKYCSGCTDVVVDVRHHYTNKKRGRVCLLKHEKESLANYISRTNILPGGPSKIAQKMQPAPKPVLKASSTAPAFVQAKPSVPSVVSLEMFPMLTVALKKGRSVKIVVNSKVEEPTVVEVIEVPITKIEEPVIVKPTELEPVVVKPVDEPVKAEAAAPSKKDRKKEYKKRKWLEAKMAEEAKLAEEKRLAEEKAEKNRQKKAARRARQAEELAKGPEPPKPEPSPEVREPTEEELMKMIKQKMLKERINELKKGRTAKA